MNMELFQKVLMRGIGEHFRRYAHALRFAMVYMMPRNFTQLLNINTTKFQVEREPVLSTRTRS